MKILLINGSPKGESSNSLRLARAFIEGLMSVAPNIGDPGDMDPGDTNPGNVGQGNVDPARTDPSEDGQTQSDDELRVLTLSKMNIAPCKGCFCCWNKTPGQCIIADAMKTVLEDKLWADVIVWSFPLYYFNVPGILKNLIDRQLPLCLPFMSDKEGVGSGSHDARCDMSRTKNVLISTCGFYSAEKNYDSVLKMFDHFLGEGNYETIFCGQGELFRVKELHERTDQYLNTVRQAGREYRQAYIESGQKTIGPGQKTIESQISGTAKQQALSIETRRKLSELLYPRDVFEAMADSSWGIEKESGEKTDETLTFTRQMAALYNKNSYDGKDRVLQITYTDRDKSYQIVLDAEGSRVVPENNLTPTTIIETPWDVWFSIARGDQRGDAALAEGKYRVKGDFSLMFNWGKFFGNSGSSAGPSADPSADPSEDPLAGPAALSGDGLTTSRSGRKACRPSLGILLAPWILFWVAVSIRPFLGGIVILVFCAVLSVFLHRRLVLYDKISLSAVELLSLLAVVMNKPENPLPVVLGYAGFGLLWLVSSFTREPLCAAYVKYNYGGDDALNNPIFMKTNRILAMAWGLLYVLIAGWSWVLLGSGHSGLTQIINNGATMLMGLFTGWFEHWYPAHVASGAQKKWR